MDATATFSLFVRDLPPRRGFLVAAGLDGCLEFLDGLRVEDDDLAHLALTGFDRASLEALEGLRFTGDVWAVPEGRIVFAGEPLLEVSAPIAEAQLTETFLLNRITVETTLASKAARSVIAAEGRDLLDFSFRRTHGVDAAMAVARTSAMCGFVATSNVEAARRYGLHVAGTMAHSYVQSFGDERAAFRAFAEDFPGRTTFLVDTYDTAGGIEAAIDVIRELRLEPPLGVRLDSGDLDVLARAARRRLDEEGLGDVRIFASGGLDDVDVARLVAGGAPIDGFGLGTRLGVSADAPSLDTVFKMVEFDGRPSSKFSPGKVSLPGRKQVFRGERPGDDVLALREEVAPPGTEPLLAPVMARGTRISPADLLQVARERFEEDLERLPEPARRLVDPDAPRIRISDELASLARRVQDGTR